eukprot:9484656-Ditylum_brightwellii.AAC.1
MAKNKNPDYLRIGDTCFTTFENASGKNGAASLHSTEDDLFQIFFLSLQAKTDGNTIIRNSEDSMGRPHLIPGTDGIAVCGDFNELFQEHKQ